MKTATIKASDAKAFEQSAIEAVQAVYPGYKCPREWDAKVGRTIHCKVDKHVEAVIKGDTAEVCISPIIEAAMADPVAKAKIPTKSRELLER
jgi:hypothetical protein